MVATEAINFNHNTNADTHDALRRKGTTMINVPEWRQFISVNPERNREAAIALSDRMSLSARKNVALICNSGPKVAREAEVVRTIDGLLPAPCWTSGNPARGGRFLDLLKELLWIAI